jgi:hypothetical protein
MTRERAVTAFYEALTRIEAAAEATARLDSDMQSWIGQEAFQAVLAGGLVPTLGESEAETAEMILGRAVGGVDEALRSIPAIRSQFRATRDTLVSIAPGLEVRSPTIVDRVDAICGRCGKAFGATRRNARYCSPACRQRAYLARRAGDTSAL